MNNFLTNQNWRYATKKFDASKIVSNEDIDFLKESIRLSVSSYGLQPYKILDISNKDIRAQLKKVSWGQSQIIDASHLFVFANQINLCDLDVDNYISNAVTTRDLPKESLDGYASFIKLKLKEKSQIEIAVWNEKQTYIALTNLINAAAELKIDITPMEGFDNQRYNEILGLTKLDLNACIVAAIGYRSNDDFTQNLKKVRKTNKDLFITIL